MKVSPRNKILSKAEIKAKIERISHEIHEHCYKENELYLIGISGRGFDFTKRIATILREIADFKVQFSELILDKDKPLENQITIKEEFDLTNKSIILVDDVLNSGKTLAYAASYLLQKDPKMLQTAILVNREHHRYPVTANFVGLSLATTLQEHIQVELGKSDGVYLV